MALPSDLWNFLFPSYCLVCGKRLTDSHHILCLSCEYRLPRNRFTDLVSNPVSQVFWGRVPVQLATALFRFEKGSPYQALLHDLKYRGNKKAGLYLGALLGQMLSRTEFAACDCLLPVPLHRRKERKRGYNQSEVIARGSASVLDLPVETRVLSKTIFLPSQTILGRYERFENVNGTFDLRPDAPDMSGKRIILVDDVLTTGATLESCCEVLFKHFSCQIFVATVAFA